MTRIFEIGFVKLHPEAKLPQKTGVESDACYDVWCTEVKQLVNKAGVITYKEIPHQYILNVDVESDEIESIEYYPVFQYKLGFTLNLPKDIKVNIYPRSSIYKTGLMLCNSVATIDEDYRGEYILNFYHVVPQLSPYKVGDKIAQMEIGIRNNIDFYETDVIDITQRGDLGFGSSGQK